MVGVRAERCSSGLPTLCQQLISDMQLERAHTLGAQVKSDSRHSDDILCCRVVFVSLGLPDVRWCLSGGLEILPCVTHRLELRTLEFCGDFEDPGDFEDIAHLGHLGHLGHLEHLRHLREL